MNTLFVVMALMQPSSQWCAPVCHDYAVRLADAIDHAAEVADVPASALVTIAYNENRFNPSKGTTHGKGPFGINPRAKWGRLVAMGCEADPAGCMQLHATMAAWLLSEERRRCGSLIRAIGAYGSGKCEGPGAEKYLRSYRWARARVAM